MLDFTDKALERLTSYVPLMQSLVWPGFLLIIGLIYRKQISACITALLKRIEGGSRLKLGPVEVGAPTPREQARKLQEEVAESRRDEVKDGKTKEPPDSRSIVVAEDLVMKKLTGDLGVDIRREVRTKGPNPFIFDGATQFERKFIGIETKYIRNKGSLDAIVKSSLDSINACYMSLSKDSRELFTILFVVVLDKDYPLDSDDTLDREDITRDVTERLSDTINSYEFPVELRVYPILELEEEFGMGKGQADN